MTTEKPRVRFCWECGKQLRGNHYAELEIDGHKRILHKRCKEYMESDFYDPFFEYTSYEEEE